MSRVIITKKEGQLNNGAYFKKQSVDRGDGTGLSRSTIWNPDGSRINSRSIDRGDTIYNQKEIITPDGRRIIKRSVQPDYNDDRNSRPDRHHRHDRHHNDNWFNRDNYDYNDNDDNYYNYNKGYDPIGERIGRDGFTIGRPDKDVRHMRKFEMGLNLGERVLDFFGRLGRPV